MHPYRCSIKVGVLSQTQKPRPKGRGFVFGVSEEHARAAGAAKSCAAAVNRLAFSRRRRRMQGGANLFRQNSSYTKIVKRNEQGRKSENPRPTF